MDKDFMNSKSMLAKLMANENIYINHSSTADTASFDLQNRILTLPNWEGLSNDMYDMLITHEVGHALITPSDDWVEKIERSANKLKKEFKISRSFTRQFQHIVNVFEDVRVDNFQKKKYPGSKINYRLGNEEFWKKDYFGIKERKLRDFNFVERANLYFKGGILKNIPFSEEEKVLLEEASELKTFDEVIAFSEKAFRFMQNKGSDKRLVSMNSDGDVVVSDIGGENTSDLNDIIGDLAGNSSEIVGSDLAKDMSLSATQDPDSHMYDDDEDQEYIPDVQSIQDFYDNLGKNVKNVGNVYYVNYPSVKISNIISDFQEVMDNYRNELNNSDYSQFIDYRKAEMPYINHMVKDFEQKKSAKMYAKTLVSKTGILNTNNVWKYKVSDDLFKRVNIEPKGKNHGMVMLIDFSGSMSGIIHDVYKHTLTLALFCQKVQIPFEVFLFVDHSRIFSNKISGGRTFTLNNRSGELYSGARFVLRNILSSRMNASQFNKMAALFWEVTKNPGRFYDKLGGTPLNQSIVALGAYCQEYVKTNNVDIMNMIILTDGYGDNLYVPTRNPFTNEEQRVGGGGSYFSLGTKDIMKCYDEVSKEMYDMKMVEQHTVILEIIKNRFPTNVIGFHIGHVDSEKGYKKTLDMRGFDVHITMNSNMIYKISEANSTHNSMAFMDQQSFDSFNAMKKKKRMMLSEFIDVISKQQV